MAYLVSHTDLANKGTITVEDNTINQVTSLDIPGRNTTAYGTAIADSFLHLLENFAFNTSPRNPVEGQLWYDTTVGVNQLKIFDGTNWILDVPCAGTGKWCHHSLLPLGRLAYRSGL